MSRSFSSQKLLALDFGQLSPGHVAGDCLDGHQVACFVAYRLAALLYPDDVPVSVPAAQHHRSCRRLNQALDKRPVFRMYQRDSQVRIGVEFFGSVAGESLDSRADVVVPGRWGESVAEDDVPGVFGQKPETFLARLSVSSACSRSMTRPSWVPMPAITSSKVWSGSATWVEKNSRMAATFTPTSTGKAKRPLCQPPGVRLAERWDPWRDQDPGRFAAGQNPTG